MVATIFAAVSGDDSNRRLRFAGWHQAGLVLGALLLSVLAALAASAVVVPAALAVILATAMLVWGAGSLVGRPLPILSPSAQVPLAWRYTMSPAQYAFSYGVGLGFALSTRVASASLYALLVVLLLDGRLSTALAATAAYALARGLPVIYATRASSAEHAMHRLEAIRPVAVRTDGLALIAAGVMLLTSTV
jgi:hypothetical protein